MSTFILTYTIMAGSSKYGRSVVPLLNVLFQPLYYIMSGSTIPKHEFGEEEQTPAMTSTQMEDKNMPGEG